MTTLVTPISHLFRTDELTAEICSLSTSLEARERTSEMRLPKTTHYHIDFDLNIGLTKENIDFLAREVKNREEIHTLTFQISKDSEVVRTKNGIFYPETDPLDEKVQIENFKHSLKVIRDVVGTNRIIGFENNNYFNTGAYNICTSKEFIVKLLEETDVMLLFDYSHAFVSCFNRNLDFDSYVRSLLSTNKCIQMHLCEASYTYKENSPICIDAHDIPQPSTTSKALKLISEYGINSLTIEYYRDKKILLNYLGYLDTLLKK